MSYLVMECRLSYAVVLDSQGRFLKTANLGYEVGQRLDRVVELREPQRSWPSLRRFTALAAAAACLCMVLVGGWQLLLAPMGTVRMQINPDVMLWVNRIDRVVKLEGLNREGATLAEGVSARGKRVDALAGELADRAMELGYLAPDGQIALTVESENEKWETATQDRLILALTLRLPQGSVLPGPAPEPAPYRADQPQTIVIPIDPGEPEDTPVPRNDPPGVGADDDPYGGDGDDGPANEDAWDDDAGDDENDDRDDDGDDDGNDDDDDNGSPGDSGDDG